MQPFETVRQIFTPFVFSLLCTFGTTCVGSMDRRDEGEQHFLSQIKIEKMKKVKINKHVQDITLLQFGKVQKLALKHS